MNRAHFQSTVFVQLLHRCYMPDSEIHDMDVITDTCAIGRIVVGSHHVHIRPATDGDLSNERHQVIGSADRIFADQAWNITSSE